MWYALPMNCPKAALFDLDDTLALSFESPSPEMIGKLRELLDLIPVAIVTGRDFPWMARDFLGLFTTSPRVDRFYVLPEGAAQCLHWEDPAWKELYTNELTDAEKAFIEKTVLDCVKETGVLEGLTVFGEQFRRKKAMIAFTSVGLDASREARYSWDPDNTRRTKLAQAIAAKLPEYDVVMGGVTTIDVTKKNVNKALGVRWLSERLHLEPNEMLFVGDSIYEGGNDFVVVPTGIQTRSTKGPQETLGIVNELLTSCTAT